MAVIFSHRPCLLHTLRERIIRRGALKVTALRATTDSPLPDFSTVLNRDRTQCHFEIRDSQPHTASPSGHAAAVHHRGVAVSPGHSREQRGQRDPLASARMTTCRATTATLSVPVFDAGNISPHLAPLFPARRPQASAPERATHMDVRQQLRGRGYASSEVHHEALVECVRGCGVRRREPGHDLHGVRARRAAKRARQRKTRHSNSAGMDRCLAGTTRAGRSRSPAHRRHAERSDVMNPRATTERDQTRIRHAHSPNARSPSCWDCQSPRCARGGIRGKGPRFLRLGRSVRYLPSDVADFVRASAVDTTSVSSSDDDSELGELRAMSLWKRGRQYWTDFTVAGRRYRKRLGTTNLRVATRRERELDRRGWTRPAVGRRTRAEAALGCDRRLPGCQADAVLTADDRARGRTAQPRQEALRRRAALGDHRDGDRGVPAHAARGRHREPHDQHGRRRAVARAQVLRSVASARGSRAATCRSASVRSAAH